jgi:predicted aspartyl protease
VIARAAALLAALLLAAPLAAFAADAPAKAKAPDPRAWPTAYESVTMTVPELLAAKRGATAASDAAKTMRITYAFRDGGLEGTEREVWSGDDYRFDVTAGPFTTAEGSYQGQRWITNENGYTLLKRGVHQRAEANARALEKTNPGDDVRMLGRLRAPADVYVLRVAPPDGREERRFYDASTLRLVRRETKYLNQLVVSTYDDYRTTGGVTIAYRTSVSDGHPENDAVWTIKDLQLGGPVLKAEIDVPGSRRIPVTMPAGAASVRLPARVDDWGRVIVRMTVNGRGLDFQLDSGADGIVLDRDVARELGLRTHGRWSSTVAGTFITSRAIIPKAEIGPVVMNDLVVKALPFSYENDLRTRVVGLLGFDFIAGCVVKIDYEHGTVDAIDATSFVPPADGMILDAVLDDQVPVVGMVVNKAVGEHFIFDTGADDVVLFSGFAKKHPEAVDDHSPHKNVSRSFNLVQASGVGGKLDMRPVVLAEMQLANVHYRDYLTMVMLGNQPAFEGEDQDGLIGAVLIRAFDVYLDYGNSRVVLVPNASTRKGKIPVK